MTHLTNEEARRRYFVACAHDRRSRPPAPALFLQGSYVIASALVAWMNRYARWHEAMFGHGFMERHADPTGLRALTVRNLARDRSLALNWSAEEQSSIQKALEFLGPTVASKLESFDANPVCGPSLRALWATARQRGLEAEQAWLHIYHWAWTDPVSGTAPAADEAVSNHLRREITWYETTDPEEPWQATVDGVNWSVRLNDFPEQRLYSLIANGISLGDFSDWPENWKREEFAPVPEHQKPRVIPAIATVEIPAARRDAGAWHSRYVEGECEAVWSEMVSLGAAVRDPDIHAAAMAVARETMRRALHNIAELILRLDAIGYEFWNEEYAYFSRKDHSGPTPPGSQDPTVFRRSTAEEIVSLHQAGERGMAVPLSLQAWVEEAGVVDLCGAHPALCFYLGRSNWRNVFAEPMMVKPQFEKRGYGPRPASEEVPFSLGRQSKAALPLRTFEGYDNYYALTLPNAAADGTFYAGRRQQFFVEYLRTCFRWGGFPGWENYAERPEKELAFLRDGLLPI